MKDISEIQYSIEELKEGKLTRAAMIEDLDAIRFEIGLAIIALENGGMDGECLNDTARELQYAMTEICSSIHYCYNNDCFGGS